MWCKLRGEDCGDPVTLMEGGGQRRGWSSVSQGCCRGHSSLAAEATGPYATPRLVQPKLHPQQFSLGVRLGGWPRDAAWSP